VNLVLLDPTELTSAGRVVLRDHRARHLRIVLNVSPGDTVRVGLVDGNVGTGSVVEVGMSEAVLDCVFDAPPPPPPRVDLLLAIPRPKVLKRLLPQLAAIGIGHLRLTNAARVERDYFDTHILSPDPLRALLIEGLQQARDTRIPTVTVHRRLKVLLEDELPHVPGVRRFYADVTGGVPASTAVGPSSDGRALLAVGPEGGWTDYERDMLAAHGFGAITLGPRVLRSDTAVVALTALLQALLDERLPHDHEVAGPGG